MIYFNQYAALHNCKDIINDMKTNNKCTTYNTDIVIVTKTVLLSHKKKENSFKGYVKNLIYGVPIFVCEISTT